jgi:hypothetical protein
MPAWAQTGEAETALPDAELLESQNATIRAIRFNIGDVFDPSNPDENKRLHRLANRLHIRTKQFTLESILLPEPGDVIDSRVNEESARALRAREYIAEATVTPVDYDPASNTVALQVDTRDSWSLSPDLKFSRTGGQNEYAVGFSEENLFGLGKEVTFARSSDVDRDETFFGYIDPNVRGSRTRLNVTLTDASDGHRTELAVGRPFFSFDSRWAVESGFTDTERVDNMYGLGEIIDKFRHEIDVLSVRGGWSRGLRGNRTRRWLVGVTADEHQFSEAPSFGQPLLLPADRKLVYPFFGVQIAEDDFRQVTELNDMGRTEDVPLGLNMTLQLGYASESFGSDRDATIVFADAHKGWEPGGTGRLFLFDLAAQTRLESGHSRNSIVASTFRYYKRNLRNHLLSIRLRTILGNHLDAENQVLLGGDSDLRGYPLRYQSGERSAILTVEQRFFTDWYPFRLVRVGYAVFADVGRVWGTDARGTENLGTLYDIGIGLRFTSPRASSESVVHIDLAFPINAPADVDSVQLSIEKKRSF